MSQDREGAGQATAPSALSVDVLVSGPWHENCYVVSDPDGETVIVDPGATAPGTLEAVRARALTPRLILCTHGHYDHVEGAASWQEALDLPCWVHERDAALFRQAPMYAWSFEKRTIRLPARVQFFQDDTSFSLGTHTITIHPTPGHTPGSVTFQVDHLLFTGDLFVNVPVDAVPKLPGRNPRVWADSLDAVSALSGQGVRYFPGHGRGGMLQEDLPRWKRRATDLRGEA